MTAPAAANPASSPEPVCPYCRSGFEPAGPNGEPADAITACPACGTPHHADCFTENGGCTIFGCTAAPAEEQKISISPTDLHPALHPASRPAPLPGASFYNLNTPTPDPGPTPAQPAPPPPLPPGSSAPPPPLAITPYAQPGYGPTGLATPQPFPGYAYGSYVRPKSRVAFVLLAVFLGSFGAHNFYTGYNKKAVIQLCLTVCTCFYAALITWIWAIVEACTVTTDDDGVLLS